jgi:hypothetical protein
VAGPSFSQLKALHHKIALVSLGIILENSKDFESGFLIKRGRLEVEGIELDSCAPFLTGEVFRLCEEFAPIAFATLSLVHEYGANEQVIPMAGTEQAGKETPVLVAPQDGKVTNVSGPGLRFIEGDKPIDDPVGRGQRRVSLDRKCETHNSVASLSGKKSDTR